MTPVRGPGNQTVVSSLIIPFHNIRGNIVSVAGGWDTGEHVEGKRMAGKGMRTKFGRRKFDANCRFDDARSSFARKTIPLPYIPLPSFLNE